MCPFKCTSYDKFCSACENSCVTSPVSLEELQLCFRQQANQICFSNQVFKAVECPCCYFQVIKVPADYLFQRLSTVFVLLTALRVAAWLGSDVLPLLWIWCRRCVVVWVTQNTLWNWIWAAGGLGLRCICRNSTLLHFKPAQNVAWIWFVNLAFHVFLCCPDFGKSIRRPKNRFGLAVWTRLLF